jgi:hypothetical protein
LVVQAKDGLKSGIEVRNLLRQLQSIRLGRLELGGET